MRKQIRGIRMFSELRELRSSGAIRRYRRHCRYLAEQFVGIVDYADTERSNTWVSQILQIPSGAIRGYRRYCRYRAEQFAGIVDNADTQRSNSQVS